MGIIPARAGFTGPRYAARKGDRDHPRSRGVYKAICHQILQLAGSSPLARGLRCVVPVQCQHPGIIPARAGFTGHAAAAPGSHWDHPRSRGVYAVIVFVTVCIDGSSPLARGLPPPGWPPVPGGGIIPARAGFTKLPRGMIWRGMDHPRSRGVYSRFMVATAPLKGSSPLARGLLQIVVTALSQVRIIPARAGFTSPMNKSVQTAQDHPRSRGVYHGRDWRA